MPPLFSFFSSKIKEALRNGAVIIDVRTGPEFDSGRIPESINIPVDRVSLNAERIRNMKRPIIFCSDSDSRSADAVRIMKEKGLKDVFDGGSWESVLRKVNSL